MRKILTVLLASICLYMASIPPAQASWFTGLYKDWQAYKQGQSPWFRITDPERLKRGWGVTTPEYWEKMNNKPAEGALRNQLYKDGLQKIPVYQDMITKAKNRKQLEQIRDHIKKNGVDKYGDKLSKLHQELYVILDREILEKKGGTIPADQVEMPVTTFFKDKAKGFKGVPPEKIDIYWDRYSSFFPEDLKKQRQKTPTVSPLVWILPLLLGVGRRIITKGL